MSLGRTTAKFFESDSESHDTVAYDHATDDEFSVAAHVVLEEKEEEYQDAQEHHYVDELFGDDKGDDEEDEFFDSETGEEEGDSLTSDDLSSCSEMSFDMEEYAVIGGVAVVAEEQVGGSGSGWYPYIDEDVEIEDVPCPNVEMVDASEGVDVVMEEVEEEDAEMEEAVDMMDVDGEFW